jgi:hypothetical protein
VNLGVCKDNANKLEEEGTVYGKNAFPLPHSSFAGFWSLYNLTIPGLNRGLEKPRAKRTITNFYA